MSLGVSDVKAHALEADLSGNLEIREEARHRGVPDAALRARQVHEERAVRDTPCVAPAQAVDQGGAVGRLRDTVVAETARIAHDGLKGIHAFLGEDARDGRERWIDREADAHSRHLTAGPNATSDTPRRFCYSRADHGHRRRQT